MNPMESADFWSTWGPPLVVLLVGLVVGLGLALVARGQAAPGSVELRARREALLAKKDSLIEQIRLLEADRDRLPEAERAARREGLVLAASAVLAELEALEFKGAVEAQVEAQVAAQAEGASAAGPWTAAGPKKPAGTPVKSGLKIGGAIAFLGVMALGLTEAAKPRGAGMSVTGGGGSAATTGAAAVQAAEAALALNPQDLAALNILTYEALLRRDFEAAMTHVEAARTVSPEHPDVLIHLAILRLSVGMYDVAAEALGRAIAAEPERGRGHLWLGLVRIYQDQRTDAVTELETALSLGLRADETAFARQMIAEAKAPPGSRLTEATAEAAGGGAAPAQTASGPSFSGPGGGGATLAGQASFGPKTAAALAELPGTVVFLMVYRNAEGRPPPVATAKASREALPWTFQFEQGHAMMGGAWPEQVWIKARLDGDGQPGSGPGDVDSALLGPFAVGATGAALVIGD